MLQKVVDARTELCYALRILDSGGRGRYMANGRLEEAKEVQRYSINSVTVRSAELAE